MCLVFIRNVRSNSYCSLIVARVAFLFFFFELGVDVLLFFSDEFPKEGLWIYLPCFCLIKNSAYFRYGELSCLSEYFFEMCVVKQGVAYCLNEVCSL